MGNRLFGEDIAGEVYRALTDLGMPTFVLTTVTPGTPTPGHLAAGTNPTRSDHNCQGLVEDYADRQVDGTLIRRGDRKFLILGDSLPSGVVPRPNDQLYADSLTYTIIHVMRDPDAAVYTCQARGKSSAG